MDTTLNERLIRIAHKDEIRELLERYCRGVDRLDEDLITSVYWPNARDRHGSFEGSGDDFARFVVGRLSDRYESTMHLLGQSLIEFAQDSARAETYFVAFHRCEEQGRSVLDVAAGRYVDELEFRNHEWRLSARTVVLEWCDSEPNLAMETWPLNMFARGVRSRDDLAYGGR